MKAPKNHPDFGAPTPQITLIVSLPFVILIVVRVLENKHFMSKYDVHMT